jgi:hypothetical protein
MRRVHTPVYIRELQLARALVAAVVAGLVEAWLRVGIWGFVQNL